MNTCPRPGEGGQALSGHWKHEAGGQFLVTILGKARPELAALRDMWVRSADSTAQGKHIHQPATQAGPGPIHCLSVTGMQGALVFLSNRIPSRKPEITLKYNPKCSKRR